MSGEHTHEEASAKLFELTSLRHIILTSLSQYHKLLAQGQMLLRFEALWSENKLYLFFYNMSMERLSLEAMVERYGSHEVLDHLLDNVQRFFQRHPEFKIGSMGLIFNLEADRA